MADFQDRLSYWHHANCAFQFFDPGYKKQLTSRLPESGNNFGSLHSHVPRHNGWDSAGERDSQRECSADGALDPLMVGNRSRLFLPMLGIDLSSAFV